MILIIDGYNVLKKLFGTAYASERQRDQFIKKLCQYTHKKNHTMQLVFDGGMSLWPEKSNPSTKMQVIYVGKNKSADDYIKDYLDEHKNYEVVLVSSDRELNNFAAQRSIPSIDAQVFLNLLQEAFEQKSTAKKSSEQQPYKLIEEDNATLDALMASLNPSPENKKEEYSKKNYSKEKQLSKKERLLLEKLKKL